MEASFGNAAVVEMGTTLGFLVFQLWKLLERFWKLLERLQFLLKEHTLMSEQYVGVKHAAIAMGGVQRLRCQRVSWILLSAISETGHCPLHDSTDGRTPRSLENR